MGDMQRKVGPKGRGDQTSLCSPSRDEMKTKRGTMEMNERRWGRLFWRWGRHSSGGSAPKVHIKEEVRAESRP